MNTTTTHTARTARTLDEALNLHRYNAADAAFLAEAAQAIAADAAYTTAGSTYAALTRDGATIAYAYRTYLTILDAAGNLPASRQPAGRMASTGHGGQGYDYHLAGFEAGNGGGTHQPLAHGAPCTTCWIALPLNGAPCANCA